MKVAVSDSNQIQATTLQNSYQLAMKKLLLLLCAVLMAMSSQAANIIFVSFHADDNVPSTAAATAGFTQAPDIGYTQLLRANGHTVTRYLTRDIPEAAVLNAADLVIISRSVPSG